MIGRNADAVLAAAHLEDELAAALVELRTTHQPAHPRLLPLLAALRHLLTERFADAPAIAARLDAIEAAARLDDLGELERQVAALRSPGPGTFGTWAI